MLNRSVQQHDHKPHLRVVDRDESGQPPASGDRVRAVRRVLVGVLGLNLAVALAKIAFGLFSGSLAMASDGVHSLLDSASNIIGLVGLAVAARPPDPNHPYGHHRYETLTSLGIAGLMLLTLFGIVEGAWSRLREGATPEVTTASFIIMFVTLGVNLLVTTWERREARRLSSSLLLADARHTTSDIFVSLSVIASLLVVRLGFQQADALIALAIAGAIAWGAWTIVRDASLALSDAIAGDIVQIERAVRSVPGVRGTHNIRSRGTDGRVWVDLHIQVDPDMRVDRAHDIASQVAERVAAVLGDTADVTVHVEPADPQHLRRERGYQPK